MTTIGFIGLGIMGAPMARNLVRAGHDVVGFNRGPRAVEDLVASGGRGATSVAEAVAGAAVVITMLPDSPDVEQVALASGGIVDTAAPGTLHIDCSTVRPATAERLAAVGAQRGLRVVDAPVSGGQAGAIEATLSIMVGGSPADFAAAQPILAALGSTIVHVGPAGAGQTVKAANQLIVGGTIALVAEALTLLRAYGVDAEAAVRVLAGGLAGNRILDRKAAAMLRHEFTPGFRVDLHHKDMGIVTAAAGEAGVAIPLGALTAQLIGAARAQGHGGLDHSALLLVIEHLSRRPTPSSAE